MPELPEVETVRRTLRPHVLGLSLTGVDVHDGRLRTPVVARSLRHMLKERQIVDIRRRAKYLLVDLRSADSKAENDSQQCDAVLLLHLGMSGKVGLVEAEVPLKKHDHVVLHLSDGRQLRFNDPRRFGRIEAFAAREEAGHVLLRDLGPEPLGPSVDADEFHRISRGSKRPVKTFIMDAKRIVGVGNIYACEALFRAGIHPSTPVGRLSTPRWRGLVSAIRETLTAAIEQGGTTLRDFRNISGEAGYFAVELQVYGRQGEPCVRCKKPVRQLRQGGRSTFYCASCQRR